MTVFRGAFSLGVLLRQKEAVLTENENLFIASSWSHPERALRESKDPDLSERASRGSASKDPGFLDSQTRSG